MRTVYFTTTLNIPISHYGEMIELLKQKWTVIFGSYSRMILFCQRLCPAWGVKFLVFELNFKCCVTLSELSFWRDSGSYVWFANDNAPAAGNIFLNEIVSYAFCSCHFELWIYDDEGKRLLSVARRKSRAIVKRSRQTKNKVTSNKKAAPN